MNFPRSCTIKWALSAGRAMRHLLHGEAGSALLLLGAAALALALANSPAGPGFARLLHGAAPWLSGPSAFNPHLASPAGWIDHALMAVFFFAVGLEIKREWLRGDLADSAHRRLPVLAAAAGMLVPALTYLAFTLAQPALRGGWAVPAATDIAFALGVLGLVGQGLPPSLRLFLLTLAVVDDLGAVAIIALAYSHRPDPMWLALAALALAAMAAVNRLGSGKARHYLPLALALWACMERSGVHATVAGVLAAFAIPCAPDRRGHSLLIRLEVLLAPWVAYVILPLFALANAGVRLNVTRATGAGGCLTVMLAVAAALLLGKQAGVLGAVWLAERSGYAARPRGAGWGQLWGVSLLAGIGFTMSLFLTALAFPAAPALADAARIGVLGGSVLSALAGYAVLRRSRDPK